MTLAMTVLCLPRPLHLWLTSPPRPLCVGVAGEAGRGKSTKLDPTPGGSSGHASSREGTPQLAATSSSGPQLTNDQVSLNLSSFLCKVIFNRLNNRKYIHNKASNVVPAPGGDRGNSRRSHWSHWTECPLLSHSIPECSMAAVSPAQLGIIPAVLRSLCCVAAAHSAVAAVDFSLVMLCDVVL